MKKFKGNRSLDQIIVRCAAKGWLIDQTRFNQGGDYVCVFPKIDGVEQMVLFNTVTGRFLGDGWNSDHNLDGQFWFDELLDLFYEPLPEDPL